MSMNDKYKKMFSDVLGNRVIDPSSYFEFYTYQLLKEIFYLKFFYLSLRNLNPRELKK